MGENPGGPARAQWPKPDSQRLQFLKRASQQFRVHCGLPVIEYSNSATQSRRTSCCPKDRPSRGGVNSRQQIHLPPTKSETITLSGWVINTPTKRIFPIDIGHDETWGRVREAIKEEKKPEFDDIAADSLDLWMVCQCAISRVVMLNSSPQRSPSILPTVLSWMMKNS
jgi:hypothetical protein